MIKKELMECMSELSDMIIEFAKEDFYMHFTMNINHISGKLYLDVYLSDEISDKSLMFYSYCYETIKEFVKTIKDIKVTMVEEREENKANRIEKLEKELEELKSENN